MGRKTISALALAVCMSLVVPDVASGSVCNRLPRCLGSTKSVLRINNVTKDEGTVFQEAPDFQHEGDSFTPFVFTVKRTGDVTGKATVRFKTVDGSAVAPDDYLSKKRRIRFGPGKTSRRIKIKVVPDFFFEFDEGGPNGEEFFQVRLRRPRNARIADRIGIGTIVDDDG